jgi:hypothetical protein
LWWVFWRFFSRSDQRPIGSDCEHRASIFLFLFSESIPVYDILTRMLAHPYHTTPAGMFIAEYQLMNKEGEVTHAREKNYRTSQKSATPGEIPSTQSGEFVREEMHHIREGKHGARSAFCSPSLSGAGVVQMDGSQPIAARSASAHGAENEAPR